MRSVLIMAMLMGSVCAQIGASAVPQTTAPTSPQGRGQGMPDGASPRDSEDSDSEPVDEDVVIMEDDDEDEDEEQS